MSHSKNVLSGSKLFGFFVLLILASCGVDQNPLSKYPEAIQNPRPPQSKPQIEEGIKSDALKIDTVDIYSFKESVKGEIQISTRILDPNFKQSKIEILNLADFPEASFDQATGVFSWTPSYGQVLTGFVSERDLIVRLEASPIRQNQELDGVTLINDKSIKILIYKQGREPKISSVSIKADFLREGGNYELEIRVEDPDSLMTDSTSPELIITAPANKYPKIKNLIPYLSLASKKTDKNNKQWVFKYYINLNKEEFTASTDLAGFTIQAQGYLGLKSGEVPFEKTVYTKLSRNILSTVTNQLVSFYGGQSNRHVIYVYDPKQEAQLALSTMHRLPKGAQFKCTFKDVSLLECVLDWLPTPDQYNQVFDFVFVIQAKNPVIDDTENFSVTFLQKYQVFAPPTAPTPTPSQPTGPGSSSLSTDFDKISDQISDQLSDQLKGEIQ